MGNSDFCLGVQKIFRIENSADLLAVGKVNGTIYKGAAIYITNPGEDSELTELTTVTEIIINNNSIDNAADTFVISGNLYCNPQKNRGTSYDGTGHKTTGSIFNYTT